MYTWILELASKHSRAVRSRSHGCWLQLCVAAECEVNAAGATYVYEANEMTPVDVRWLGAAWTQLKIWVYEFQKGEHFISGLVDTRTQNDRFVMWSDLRHRQTITPAPPRHSLTHEWSIHIPLTANVYAWRFRGTWVMSCKTPKTKKSHNPIPGVCKSVCILELLQHTDFPQELIASIYQSILQTKHTGVSFWQQRDDEARLRWAK